MSPFFHDRYASQHFHPPPTVSDNLENDFVMYGSGKTRRDSDQRSEENYFVNPLLNRSVPVRGEHSSAAKVSTVDKLSQIRRRYPVLPLNYSSSSSCAS